MEKPKQLNPQEVDLYALRKICQRYVNFIDSDQCHEDNDYKNYIFETAMETIYGDDVWKFVNGKR